MKASLGDQELEILRYVSEHAPATVGDVAAGFGEPRGLARTTILTVMERLRRKGYLTRSVQAGVYRYRAQMAQADLLKRLVGEFVDRTLAGSVTPFVAYLVENGRLSAEETAELRRLLDEIDPEEQP